MFVNTCISCIYRTSDLKGAANVLDKWGPWKQKEYAMALHQCRMKVFLSSVACGLMARE